MSVYRRPASLAAHPRARRDIRMARGWGALAGFALAALAASSAAGVDDFDIGVRALAGGVVGGLVAWVAAVVVWRQLMRAEIRAAMKALAAGDAECEGPGTPEGVDPPRLDR